MRLYFYTELNMQLISLHSQGKRDHLALMTKAIQALKKVIQNDPDSSNWTKKNELKELNKKLKEEKTNNTRSLF